MLTVNQIQVSSQEYQIIKDKTCGDQASRRATLAPILQLVSQ